MGTTKFTAPGPGEWALDRSHYPNGTTPISQWLLTEGCRDGFERVFKELGVPAQGVNVAFVRGFMYTRLQPLIGGDKPPRRLPPDAVLKLATRVHPEFRARNKAAQASLRERPSNAVVKQWEDDLRPRLVATNTRFQGIDPDALNDDDLQAHISELLSELRDNFVLHFWLHGHDLGPIARYLHSALGWGLDANEAIDALAGASPSTHRPLERLVPLRVVVEQSTTPVQDLDDVRALSGEASHILERYLDERGHVLTTGYDLDSKTLLEMPATVLKTIRSATPAPDHNHETIAADLRNQVPPSHRSAFDQLLLDARNVMDMRDDNGPLTIEWPVGLLRRALLSAGSRLQERGMVDDPAHVLEATPAEARQLFTAAPLSEFGERASNRQGQASLDAPATLGPPESDPPLDVLPPALAELIAMTQTAMKYIGIDGSAPSTGMTGAGVGKHSYVGIARVASSIDDAIDRLEPGDVLIVRATSPAFNAILGIAGAVVTADGGVLSHAAVLARELGIPAVIGVPDALSIRDGATIEVDPVAGTIRTSP